MQFFYWWMNFAYTYKARDEHFYVNIPCYVDELFHFNFVMLNMKRSTDNCVK